MNIRKWAYLRLVDLRGQAVEKYYKKYKKEDQEGVRPDTTKNLLIQVLEHCEKNVPYYRRIMEKIPGSFYENPQEYLLNFPILTKDILREYQEDLKSADLSKRKWHYNSSGGSTGQPGRFVQDLEFETKTEAIAMLHDAFLGREIGDYRLIIWGSIRDIEQGSEKWRAQMVHNLANNHFVNAFRMSPERMRDVITIVNTKRPKMVLTYAESIYEIAKFAEQEKLSITPPGIILSTASTMHPFMREKVEEVFQCKVYDRYGSREVGSMAAERPGRKGYWVPPWGNFIEIVDDEGNRVPDGVDGDITITSLTNYAMPLIRYRIADRGTMSPQCKGKPVQVLESILGRTVDHFRAKDGTLCHSCYFTMMLFLRDWIKQFQVIQKSLSCIEFRIVKASEPTQKDFDEIVEKTRMVMGKDCEVNFVFVDNIPPVATSGKRRYTISEIWQ